MIHGNLHGEYDDQADVFRFSADVGLFIADSSKFICLRANRQTNSGSPQNWVVQHGAAWSWCKTCTKSSANLCIAQS